eukprot:147980_1
MWRLLICILLSNPTHSTILTDPISTNTTLTLSGSPYTIVSSITVNSDVLLQIENGVEIIFMGDYTLNIYGSIIYGCNDIDTSLYSSRGLVSDPKGHIHSDTSLNAQQVVVRIYENAFGSFFCNVLFE